MSHTAGPWTGFLDERDGHAAWLIGPSSARPILAEVSADAECGLTGATVEANARLIAAAPELLAVAKAYLESLQPYADAIPEEGEGGDRGWWEHYRSVAAAIAKAEGREP